jgi:DNA repair protein RadC
MEQSILTVAREFIAELNKLNGLKPGTQASIQLKIELPPSYSTDTEPKLELSCHFFDGKNYGTVAAASLGSLMDEVHRRLGFADREHFQIEAAQRALTGIEHKPQADEDVFTRERNVSWQDPGPV